MSAQFIEERPNWMGYRVRRKRGRLRGRCRKQGRDKQQFVFTVIADCALYTVYLRIHVVCCL